jgi:hypothetical protein
MSEESPWKGAGPPGLIKVSFVFMALLAAGSAVLAVVSAAGRDLTGLLVFGAGAVFLGHLLGAGVIIWWRPRRTAPAPKPADGALTFRYSGWSYYWVVSLLLLMVPALVLLGLAFLLREDRDAVGVVVALVAFAAAVLIGWMPVRLLSGGPGRLRITPDGLEHRGPGFTHRLPWRSVVKVFPASIGGSPLIVVLPSASEPVDIEFTWPTRVGGRRVPLLPSMAIRGMWLADDPAVVYHTLWHYHVNPEHRVELATGAAVDRIHQRRFLLR